MHVIRGTYDGETIRALPTEELPHVEGEVPVEIVFAAEDVAAALRQRRAAAERLTTARAAMAPLEVPVWELIEDGRHR